MSITIHQFRCLSDNYGFLVRDDATGRVAAIDTPDAATYERELEALGWGLDLILNTHWHPDHAGGNSALKARYGAQVVAPAEVARLSPIDREIAHGDIVSLGDTRFEVIDTGGHTQGHVSFHDAADAVVFVGDTLFTLGCGRMFEGTPSQFWASLGRLAALPEETRLFCAHEYTASNLRFARTVDPGEALARRGVLLEARIAAGMPTVPTTIGEEKATNPFLRAPALALASGTDDPAEAFGIVRGAKDMFKG
ncbi:hydroxyacylglutathione hydrolase [Sphingomonas sp.]|uniref:hydroxyacylglutathione hydrolase n=1 Tax=Sphingomonas sp. TaxID=28214 RepID=UPI000DB1F544|nr:hydroxyacylglutathione hydrolase [Sphingomonas sp.]PZU07536.1 MAG: hydroxyacylglutathione hydrolase [Sphingomonas sp.]